MKASLTEIFSAAQGEGPYIGQRQIFVRFAGCHRSCAFCDTPREAPAQCRIEWEAGSGEFEQADNPFGLIRLADVIGRLNAPRGLHRHVSFTGGEPLLQAGFLAELIPLLKNQGLGMYLETAGDLPEQLDKIARKLDVVAADIKLPGVTGEAPQWERHVEFFKICRRRKIDTFAKIVVGASTSPDELETAGEVLMRGGGVQVPVVLQPLSSAESGAVPSAKQLLLFQRVLSPFSKDVRIIPQAHKMMKML